MTSQTVLPQGVLGQSQQIVIPGQTNGQGPPIVIPAQTTTPNERKVNNTAGLVTGILQILIGIIEVTATAIALSLGTEYRSFWGIWAGIGLYGFGGVLGVMSSRSNKGMIIAYMIFSIISSIVAPCQMIYDAVASSYRGYFECSYCTSDPYSLHLLYEPCGDVDCETTNGPTVAHGIAAVVAAVEMFVAIVAASYSCCGACCADNSGTSSTSVTQGQTYIIQYTQGTQPQTVTTQPQTVTTTPNHQFTYPSAPADPGYTAQPMPADPPPAYEPLRPDGSTSHPYQTLSTPTTAQPQPYEQIPYKQ